MSSVIETPICSPYKIQPSLSAILVCIGYYLGAKLGLCLSTPPDYIAAFWPPNTVVLAAILISKRQSWWFFILAMTPAYLYAALEYEVSTHRIVIYYLANCTEILVAAYSIKYFLKNKLIKFNHFNEVLVFLLSAVLVSPIISAFIASLTIFYEAGIRYWPAWRVWFLSDALGHLTLTPVLILWFSYLTNEQSSLRKITLNRLVELIFFILSLFLVSFISLRVEIGVSHVVPALLYSPLPVLLWGAIRFGPLAVYSSLFVITIVAIWNAVNGLGPFSSFSAPDNVFSLQLFMFALSVPMMLLSALLSERKQAKIDQQEQTNLLKSVIDSSLDFIFVKNTDLKIILANKSYASAIGKKPEELLGHNDIDNGWNPELVNGNPSQSIRGFEQDDKAVLNSEVIRNSYDLINIDGDTRIFDTHKFPLLDSEGNIIGVLGVSRDMTARTLAEKALQKSEEHLRLSQLYGKIGTWEADFITTQQTWSEVVSRELGFPNIANPVWDDFLSTIHIEDRAYVVKECQLHCDKNKEYEIEYRIIDTEKNIRWMQSAGKAEFDANGQPILMRGIVRDITNQKMAEKKLQLSSCVFAESREGIMITNPEGIVVEVNPSFCDITGYSRDEIINHNPNILSSGRQNSEFYTDMWKSIVELGFWQGEVWNHKKDGTVYAELLSISSIKDEEGKVLHYVGIFTDITHSKKQQENLEKMAHYDVLTQLPNRTLLADRFTQAIAHSKRQENLLAVCFLDLDDFKPVNDLYGHETGDKLLIEVADSLKAIIRDEDTVSRQGGDEFALLLGDIDSFPHCEQMLKRIINSLSQPYLIDEKSLLISASIGVTLYPQDNSNLDTLLRHADQAMYEAKQAGRNRYHLFNKEQDQRNVHKHNRLNEIHDALENSEMCLYYQPKVNMATGKVFGTEALIRWIHPDRGLIPPLDFLPIIEETELEITIGNWVIINALKQLDAWKAQGIDLEISVNISSYHLQSPAFIADLEKSLSLYPKVHSKSLQLEILESSALGDLQTISNTIKTCIEIIGVNIALDDFGTGYSSLTHLRNLPAKTIKIDQTFVIDVLDDPNDQVIIDGVIGLANAFNREVIAEGVETTEHGLMLLVMGCNKAQGYGIARPMPILDFQNWLNNYTPNQQWLSYANKRRTGKEKKIKLFKLTLAQWAKNFENNINAEPGTDGQWPILKRTKCHCGIWIKRARQEQLFEDAWLMKLENVHNTMHDIADNLFKTYQEGDLEKARKGLHYINQNIDSLISVLEQSE